MRRFIVLLLFLASCFSTADLPIVQGPSPKKQKQKIALLQKKLQLAEKEYKKAEDELQNLSSEIEQAQLTLIRRQVDDYERKKEKSPYDFLSEREALYRMIQSGPTPAAFEAQVELDRILRIITEVSDDQ